MSELKYTGKVNPQARTAGNISPDAVIQLIKWYIDTNDIGGGGDTGGGTETDPVFTASPAAAIGNTDISNWNDAHTISNTALVDADFGSQGIMRRSASSGAYSILTDNSTAWNTALQASDNPNITGLWTFDETLTIGAAKKVQFGAGGNFVSSGTIDNWNAAYTATTNNSFEPWIGTKGSAFNKQFVLPASGSNGSTDSVARADHYHAVLTRGSYLTGSNYDGSTAREWAVNASTSGNTNVVARDGSGNFSAGTITANLTGTASTATNATNVYNNAESGTTNRYIAFMSGAGGAYRTVMTNSSVYIKPSTGAIYCNDVYF